MSTKATISFNDDYHLYEQVFDDSVVYLQLDKNIEFQRRDNYYGETIERQITIAIPRETWKHIVRNYVEVHGDEL